MDSHSTHQTTATAVKRKFPLEKLEENLCGVHPGSFNLTKYLKSGSNRSFKDWRYDQIKTETNVLKSKCENKIEDKSGPNKRVKLDNDRIKNAYFKKDTIKPDTIKPVQFTITTTTSATESIEKISNKSTFIKNTLNRITTTKTSSNNTSSSKTASISKSSCSTKGTTKKTSASTSTQTKLSLTEYKFTNLQPCGILKNSKIYKSIGVQADEDISKIN